MEIRVRLPKVPSGLGSNLLGVLGLVAVIVAIGMLAGVAWAVLAGGLIAVGLAVVAQLGEQVAQRATEAAVTAATTELPQLRRAA